MIHYNTTVFLLYIRSKSPVTSMLPRSLSNYYDIVRAFLTLKENSRANKPVCLSNQFVSSIFIFLWNMFIVIRLDLYTVTATLMLLYLSVIYMFTVIIMCDKLNFEIITENCLIKWRTFDWSYVISVIYIDQVRLKITGLHKENKIWYFSQLKKHHCHS